ncbi:MAG: hypothetical protein KUA43_00240 [Hoeflea sp.]|uniref:hypothetical protein n=1 Tax=Hoeflea sp. TaxID=1940281 RepID=UPI001D96F534|nr:hypothetical protein [Hoeflea sp.]MBU4530266.1 hypothetical protein [Alphaproteobacteria bacterium]MBU4545053.1 hypothetical protein [Alphaproteobacteria bacterium]MBU4549747.1 hypothetical protein [Alphaproteobacteria bacterium]MBV1721856.1 hypothetical protein [Hoeflea sp.]MBV1783264.1 hypothetical protein [Hoeflea sp.]
MAGRNTPAGGEENRTGAGTPLTRVSAGRPAGAMAITASGADGKDGFGGAGRANETNRPPRMIATIPGTTRRPEGIGSDTGGARAGGPKPNPSITSGLARTTRPAFRPWPGMKMPEPPVTLVTRGLLWCRMTRWLDDTRGRSRDGKIPLTCNF